MGNPTHSATVADDSYDEKESSDEKESLDEVSTLVSTKNIPFTTFEKFRYLMSSHARQFKHTSHHTRLSMALSYLVKVIKAIAFVLLPSFLTTTTAQPQPETNKKRNSVKAIDGLRGLSCLIVFNGHLAREFGGGLFWQGMWNGRNLFVQWPFIHLLFSGRSMVFIFWVIGGYTLSIKPLKQLHAGEYAAFQKTWSSSLVRRGFRLYLPPVLAVFIIGVLTWLGIFEIARAIKHDPVRGDYLSLMEDFPPRESSLVGQSVDAYHKALLMFKIWDWDGYTKPGHYNDAYWTIPVQYRTALFMFLVLLAGSRMKANYRTLLISILVYFGLCVWKRDEITTFFAGMLLADIDIRRSISKGSLPFQESTTSSSGLSSRLRRWHVSMPSRLGACFKLQHLYLFMFVLGWLFCSAACVHLDYQPIIATLAVRFPFLLRAGGDGGDSSAIRSIGAIILTYGVIHCTYIHPLFTSRIALYLGKLSFSLYLVHGVVLRSVLYSLMPHIYAAVGTNGPASHPDTSGAQFAGSYALGFIVSFPLAIWAADVFWRLVENKTSDFTAWIDGKISPRDT